jgi:rSAM/selenodomain-associated transferase 1
MNRTIIIMAKVPQAGNVKTRLRPFLSTEECQSLATAFLHDTIGKALSVGENLIVVYSPAAEKSFFSQIKTAANLTLVPQTGIDLGERMANAFEFAARQYSNLLMIGTDSPTFPPEFIEQSFEFIENGAELVLGKSADGGFYLIAMKRNFPGLFEAIEWSSPRVFDQISANIKKLKISVRQIPDWYDVDTIEDLRRLRDELSQSETAPETAPETVRWIISHAEIFNRKI